MMYSQSYLYFPPRGLSAHADIEGQATASPPLGLSANCIPHFSATVRVARHGRQAQIPRPLKSGPCERCLEASDAFLVIRALDCCSSDVHVSYTCSIAAPADVDRNRCSYPLATELQGGRQDTHAVQSNVSPFSSDNGGLPVRLHFAAADCDMHATYELYLSCHSVHSDSMYE